MADFLKGTKVVSTMILEHGPHVWVVRGTQGVDLVKELTLQELELMLN